MQYKNNYLLMTWDGVVSTHHSKHLKELGITQNIKAYIGVLKKIAVSFERPQSILDVIEVKYAVGARAIE